MSASLTGLVNGIDTNKLISAISQSYQRPILLLQSQAASYNTTLTAWGNLKGGLSSLQSAMSGLGNIAALNNRSVNVADSTVATASVSKDAPMGTYSLSNIVLAQAQSLYSQSFSSADNVQVGTGTLSIQVGSGAATSVTIDSTNGTLNGIANAINSANTGVNAAVVYDGTGYRLTLTGANAGAKNTFTVSVSGATGSLGALSYDSTTKNMTQSTAAQDASAVVNGLTVTNSSNTFTQAIPGVTFNLLKASGATTIQVNQDGSAVTKAVQDFVTGFNNTMQTMNDLTKYDATTKQGGPLLGDPAVQTLRTQLLNLITGVGQGLAPSSQYNSLGSVGINLNADGTISLDSGKLSQALSKDFNTVAGLFGQVGVPTNASVKFVSAGSNTQAGTYAVNISTAAAQATTSGAAPIQSSGIANAENLTITFQAQTVSVALASGSTITTVVNDINAALQNKGITDLSASNSNGSLVLGTGGYGSAETFTVVSDQAATNGTQTGIGTTIRTATGVDVAGTVNGQATSGSGQNLTVIGGGGAQDMKLQIVGQVTGNLGTVSVSNGLYQQLNTLLSQAMDSKSGLIAAASNSINATLDGITNKIKSLQDTADQQTQLLQQQFQVMQATLSQLQQTGNYITAFFNSYNPNPTGKP